MLTTDSAEVVEFLQLWPAPFGRDVRAKQRRAYIAIDYANGPDSWCGSFRGDSCGTIESLISAYHSQIAVHGKTF